MKKVPAHSILKLNYNFSKEKLLFFIFTIKGDFMDGEIDLELYTISIIRLNTAFEKLQTQPDSAKTMFEDSLNDLETIYKDIVNDLNQEEVNLNEYYLFFQNGKQTFPQYIEILESINNTELNECVDSLINVFKNLNKISDAFNGMIKWLMI